VSGEEIQGDTYIKQYYLKKYGTTVKGFDPKNPTTPNKIRKLKYYGENSQLGRGSSSEYETRKSKSPGRSPQGSKFQEQKRLRSLVSNYKKSYYEKPSRIEKSKKYEREQNQTFEHSIPSNYELSKNLQEK
jgi:hypothetical protein